MLERLRHLLPDPSSVREHRALRWLGPALHQPRLWHISRRGIAMGLAIGVFFGLLVPIAQIPFAALTALILRANIPAAIGSTLITNPFTFAPVYFAAYHLGEWLLGRGSEIAAGDLEIEKAAGQASTGFTAWLELVSSIGVPLALGLAILATVLSILIYFAVHWTWRLRIIRAWQHRRKKRSKT
jgi:uncharacterized protein (DUF2062 family)